MTSADTPAVETRSHLEPLDRNQCFALLAEHTLGRLAVSIANQPVIFPITYALDGHSIVFKTDPGTKLYGARGRKVCFEIAGVDADQGTGWSVLVVGTAEVVEKASEQRRLDTVDLGAWNPGPKQHWLRLRTDAVTGRRLTRVEVTVAPR